MKLGSDFLGHVEHLFGRNSELDEIYFNTPDSPGAGFLRPNGTVVANLCDSPLHWFSSVAELMAWIQDIAALSGTRIDPVLPSAGGKLPERPVRWHAIFPPAAPRGLALVFRRERFFDLSFSDFKCHASVQSRIENHMKSGGGLLISGASGSGKTSLLAVILRTHLFSKRMVIIESIQELHGLSPAFVELSCRPPNLAGNGEITPRWLVQEALRIRPQGLVVGEIRGGEAGAFIDAATSGHPHCMATIHAESSEEGLRRLIRLSGHSLSTTGAIESSQSSELLMSLRAARLAVLQMKASYQEASAPEITEFIGD